jgi:uncharacterized protein (DUF1778 family)
MCVHRATRSERTNPATTPTKSTKSSRLNIRTTDAEKHLLEQAAALSRMTASQFVMEAALRSAEAMLADQTRFALAPEEWQAFKEMLERPARVLPALRSAAAKPSPFSER